MRHETVRTRPLTSADARALSDFYRGLSPLTLHARFFVDSLSPEAAASAATPRDERTHVAVVAETIGRSGASIIGVARAVIVGHDPSLAEFAIVVTDDRQGNGIGTALITRLALDSWRRGITRWRIVRLSGNTKVDRLIERVGTLVARTERGGVVEATYRLVPARVGAT